MYAYQAQYKESPPLVLSPQGQVESPEWVPGGMGKNGRGVSGEYL